MTVRPLQTRLPGRAGVVYLLVLLDLSAFGIILPSLPFYAEELGATGFGLGLLLAAYSTAKLLGTPLLGRISDRAGRRPVMIFGLVGSALALLLTAMASSLSALIAALSFAGLLSCSIATSQAVIADVTEPRVRARQLGLLGASIGMGFILGPATGVALARYPFAVVAASGAAVATLGALLALLLMPETLPEGTRRGHWLSFRDLSGILRRRPVARLLLTAYLTTFAFVGMETTFAYLGARRFGIGQRGFGAVLVFVGAVVIAVQGGMIGRTVARFGERRVALLGCVLLGGSLASVPAAPTLSLAIAALGVLALGRGLVAPTVPSLLSRHTMGSEQGSALGLGESVSAGARATGPLLAGWLYDLAAPLPYVVCGALALVAALALATVSDPE